MSSEAPGDPVDVRGHLRHRTQVALVITTLLGVAFGVASIGYPMTVGARVGAGLFPAAVAVLLIVCAIASLIIRPNPEGTDATDAVAEDDEEQLFGDAAWRVPVLVAILVAYIVMVDELGHLITSCLLAWSCLLLIGGRSWWQQLLFGLALGIGTAEVFARLGVHLPLGVLLT